MFCRERWLRVSVEVRAEWIGLLQSDHGVRVAHADPVDHTATNVVPVRDVATVAEMLDHESVEELCDPESPDVSIEASIREAVTR